MKILSFKAAHIDRNGAEKLSDDIKAVIELSFPGKKYIVVGIRN